RGRSPRSTSRAHKSRARPKTREGTAAEHSWCTASEGSNLALERGSPYHGRFPITYPFSARNMRKSSTFRHAPCRQRDAQHPRPLNQSAGTEIGQPGRSVIADAAERSAVADAARSHEPEGPDRGSGQRETTCHSAGGKKRQKAASVAQAGSQHAC